MSLAALEKKISKLKEVCPDDRIDLNEEITEQEDRIANLREILNQVPDKEPEEGVQDPRNAFVDKLMAEREVNVR